MEILEGKNEDLSMSGDNSALVHTKHPEEASSSGLPKISSPVAVVSSDQDKHQVDHSTPLVDDRSGGAGPKTSQSTSSSETSSLGVSVLLPGTKILARSSSKTWNAGTIVEEGKKECFLVEFPDSEQETIKQKYIVTSNRMFQQMKLFILKHSLGFLIPQRRYWQTHYLFEMIYRLENMRLLTGTWIKPGIMLKS